MTRADEPVELGITYLQIPYEGLFYGNSYKHGDSVNLRLHLTNLTWNLYQ
jgi:hypothetical protein